jgi:hypothetical protein
VLRVVLSWLWDKHCFEKANCSGWWRLKEMILNPVFSLPKSPMETFAFEGFCVQAIK